MTGRAALTFAIASVAAGLLNYSFQVHGAAVLDAAAFGRMSEWLAEVSVLSAIAPVAQFASLEVRAPRSRLSAALAVVGLASVVIVAAHILAGYGAPRVVLGASSVVGAIVLYAVIGQLQARLRLAEVAAAIFATAALRASLPFAWPREVREGGFLVAHAAATFAGIVVAAALGRRFLRAHASEVEAPPLVPAVPPSSSERWRLHLLRPALLAFATVAFPFRDVLVLSWANDAATTGQFSRAALAARIVFFAGAAPIQVILSHQRVSAETGQPGPPFVRLAERWLAPSVIVGSLLLAAGVDMALLHTHGEERVWLFASCLDAAVLIALVAELQRLAAHRRLGAVAIAIGLAIASSAVGAAAATLGSSSDERVSRYLLAAIGLDAIAFVVARAQQPRSRSKLPAVGSPS